jgi:hypothetical protein
MPPARSLRPRAFAASAMLSTCQQPTREASLSVLTNPRLWSCHVWQGDDSPGEDSTSGSGYSQPRLVTTAGPYGPPAGGHGVRAAAQGGNGADEEQLVENICTPGGLRAQPDREDLRLFVESAAGVSGQRVAQLLHAKIVRPPCSCVKMPSAWWQAKGRTLSVLSKRFADSSHTVLELSD